MVFNVNRQFYSLFNKQPLLFAAPGRVNLIGEHTDYNDGFVLPGAIDKRMYIGIARNDTYTLNVLAIHFNEAVHISINDLQPRKDWSTYLTGMFFHIIQQGHKLSGVDVVVDGDVPIGGGMSSSAALCCAFGLALNELFDLGITKMELALLAQKTEHTFAGVKCGIMDQFASLHGKAGHVIKLDCRNIEHEYIPFDFPDYKIVMVNTMIKHSLASSEYNVRRQQCEEGVSVLKKFYQNILSLRDVEMFMLREHRGEMSDTIFDRCSYVIEENERLLKGCEALKQSDLGTFGKLMYASHEGLSKKYEVSCPELDFLVKEARRIDGVMGARMMGGGFGGCTINIVRTENVETFTNRVQLAYAQFYGTTPDVYVTQIEDGAKKISLSL